MERERQSNKGERDREKRVRETEKKGRERQNKKGERDKAKRERETEQKGREIHRKRGKGKQRKGIQHTLINTFRNEEKIEIEI